MRTDIVIAGVGGQGILTIATVICRAALKRGLRIKQTEVHGMAQRGGAVQTHLRLSSEPIHSDIIPEGCAGLIIAMEPMEGLRYLPWLAPEGWLVSNTAPVRNIPDYPQLEELLAAARACPRHVLFDAAVLARDQHAPRAVNMAMLGAATPFLGMPPGTIESAIAEQFSRRGTEVAEANARVYRAALQLGLGAGRGSGPSKKEE